MNDIREKAVSKIKSGYTNEVWRTDEGTVAKRYRNFSIGSIIYFLLNLLFFRELATARRRIETEKDVRKKMSEVYDFPDILHEQYPWLELELIEGSSVSDSLENGEIDPEKAGKLFGGMASTFHRNDCYRNDWNLEDVFLKNGRLIMVDLEFGGVHTTELRKKVDRAFLMYQSRLMSADKFEGFYKGMQKEIDISKFEVILGFFAAFFTALIYFWDDGKPYFVIKNWYNWWIR